MTNVLWIQTDEQRPDSLGCYGSSWARTPNIDALAASGTVFRTAVCQSPVCVPSRSSQLTARYPQEINTLHNNVGISELIPRDTISVFPEKTVTLPELLAERGAFATASIGKIHTPRPEMWQEVAPIVNDLRYAGYYELAAGYDESALKVIKRPGYTPVILAGTYPSLGENPSRAVTDQAISWLKERRGAGPFVLRASHNWPHTPVLPPRPYDSLYDPGELPIRTFDAAAYRSRAAWDREVADAHRMRDLTIDQIRQIWKDYMGLCAYVDHEVGRLLQTVDELGLRQNTVILFSSDHGKSLGEWGATEKGFFDNEVWRVPFIWSWPGVIPMGAVRDEPCELLDTARTLFGLLGLAPHDTWRGRDLFSSRGPTPTAVFGEIGWPNSAAAIWSRPGITRPSPHWQTLRVAVRTTQYRMDESWVRNGRRVASDEADGNLFDLLEDPGERTNVWSEKRYEGIVRELHGHLDHWFAGVDKPDEIFIDS